MLRTNLFAKANNDDCANIALAVKYEYYNMMIELLTDKATALIAKIENPKKGTTEEMIAGWKSELDVTNQSIDEYDEKACAIEEKVAPYLEIIDEKLLRILACAEQTKLEKYAIEWDDDEAEALYEALCNIHEVDIDKIKTANFKKSTDIIEKIVRLNLTIAETEYNDKVAVRLNATDLRMINEAWVRGFRNKYKKNKDTDEITYKETSPSYLVSRRKKDGEVIYDWSKFNAILVKITIAKIAAKQGVTSMSEVSWGDVIDAINDYVDTINSGC